MSTEQNENRLRELGLTVGEDVVRYVVGRLERSDSVYSIWKEGGQPHAARNTIRKIRYMWLYGDFEFLRLVPNSPPQDKANTRLPPQPNGNDEQRGMVDGRSAAYEALGDIPDMEWSIRNLENLRVPPDRAPTLLALYDRMIAGASRSAVRLARDVLFLSLCFEIQLYSLYGAIPERAAKSLVRMYARGLFLANRPPKTLDLILKYQPWRSDEHRKVMLKALQREAPRQKRDPLFQRFLRWLRRPGPR